MEESVIKKNEILEPQPGISDYLLLIRPDGEIRERVRLVKETLQAGYGVETVAASEVYVTVAAFSASAWMEETLMRWIQRICCRQKSFQVMLNNFSCSPRNTLFIRVQDPEPFGKLVVQLNAINDFTSSPLKADRRPRLCLARNLSGEIFREIMLDYSQRIFNARFTAGELLLAKKNPGSELLKTINVFHFLPMDKNFREEYFTITP